MKVSFIATVYNEEPTIKLLLESLLCQTKLPDEIIIVDGGSSDRTVAKIKNQKSKIKDYKGRFLILSKNGNRAVGRNEAIRNASSEIIVCSDAGCILDKDWVKNITEPFVDRSIDVVSGYYKPAASNIFQKCLATYTCVMPDKVNTDDFLPSSRSVAFKKSAWERVGGYPEDLNTCEDLVFAKKLKKKKLNSKFAPGAIVCWPQRHNLKDAFLQFFNYALGDGKAHYFRNNTFWLFARYILGFYLVLLAYIEKSFLLAEAIVLSLIAYVFWSIVKNYKYVNNWRAFYFLPLIQIVSDLAVLAGTVVGILSIVK